ncbi:C-type lectin domain family 14 member A [Chelonia mydas]|uniref:C-type lectin domain family 14 member A n=1 Tax=Chelonia mydas TaxID=8469 RepID=UPI001CA96558|nr:C-type lectin domain family 14 member A [Chelonia mydas]
MLRSNLTPDTFPLAEGCGLGDILGNCKEKELAGVELGFSLRIQSSPTSQWEGKMRGAIPLCVLLHASSVLCGAEQPRGNHTWCEGSGACYSVHLAQVPFGRAQEACALRGGALSTASGQAEVRAILALLRVVAAGPGSWVFWLGLVRRAPQCTQVERPLRGFSWLAGTQQALQGEPEELDKWVKEPSRSCTTRRCAGLQVTAGRQDLEPWGWRERTCKNSTTQGYVCKYPYNGTCPAPRPQGARSLLFSLPYQLHSAALDFSPPGTELVVACPGPQGDVRLRCELGQGGYSWTGAGEQLCPCPSGYRSPSTGACLEPGDCTSAQGAFLCVCAQGFLLGADKKSCVRPGHAGGSARAAPHPTLSAGGTLPSSSSGAPPPPSSPQPSTAGEVKSSSSPTYVFILVATAVVTVVILVGAVLGVFKLCFMKSPSSASQEGKEPAPAAASESDAEATSTSSENSLKARGDAAERLPGEPSPEEEAPPGN